MERLMRTKPEIVTYEIVCNAIEELVANNEKVSVRNVISKVGGSATKISDFLRRYGKEKNLISGFIISDNLLAALSSEHQSIKLKIEQEKAAEVKSLINIIEDLKLIIAKNEKDLEDFAESKQYVLYLQEQNKVLEADLKSAKNTADVSLTRLGGIEEKYKAKTQECKELLTKLSNCEQSQEKMKSELITWKARAEQSEKQFSALLPKIKNS